MRSLLILLFMCAAATASGQDLPTRWDELTASDWQEALEKSNHTAILPIGVLEKHGPHAPIGSALSHAREWAARFPANSRARPSGRSSAWPRAAPARRGASRRTR